MATTLDEIAVDVPLESGASEMSQRGVAWVGDSWIGWAALYSVLILLDGLAG